jgi:large subunit ribosomal protein L22
MYRYAYKAEDESTIAKVVGMALPISWKHSIVIADFIRGRSIIDAKKLLEGVIALKTVVPFKKFNFDLGHKRGKIAAGGYPAKASGFILKLINSAEANGNDKGLIGESLYIEHICVHKAGKQWHYGRKRRRVMKRCHIEIVLKENPELKAELVKKSPKKSKEKKQKPEAAVAKEQKAETQKEEKIEPKKEEIKPEKKESKAEKAEVKVKLEDNLEKKEKPKKPKEPKEKREKSAKVKNESETQEKVEK